MSIVRSFEVRATSKELVCNLSRDLDNMLVSLQGKGWKILNVHSVPVKEWDYPKYFKSTLFVIVAEHEDVEEKKEE